MLQVRKPAFRVISPWVYFSSWSFAILNIVFFAPTFIYANGSQGLVLVGLIPSFIWGIVFIILGISMIFGLLSNRWGVIKTMLGFGLFVKALFAWALVFTFFIHPETLGVVGIWLGIMVWQGLCIIYFTPVLRKYDG